MTQSANGFDANRELLPEAQPAEQPIAERRVPWWNLRSRLVLVPLDGSPGAKLALAPARLLARLAGASIQVVHVSEHKAADTEELLRNTGLEPQETDGLVVEQASGEPGEAIAELAERHQAMLIAMTIRGLSQSEQWQVSPVVESVLQHAPCPVLLLRPGLEQRVQNLQPPRRLLLPLDGTPSAALALGPALDLAELVQADVDILNVATQDESPREPGSLTAPRYIDQAHYEWPAWAQEFASRFGTALGQYRPNDRTRVFVRSGDAPQEIVRFAEEEGSDLIVLEWRGRLAGERGQVIKRVLAEMPCPVLLLQVEER